MGGEELGMHSRWCGTLEFITGMWGAVYTRMHGAPSSANSTSGSRFYHLRSPQAGEAGGGAAADVNRCEQICVVQQLGR
jgi:hypothetical protein